MKKMFCFNPRRFILLYYLALFFLLSLFSACKSPPLTVDAPPPDQPQPQMPSWVLAFSDIEADDPEKLRVLFNIKTENQIPAGIRAGIASWRLEIDGQNAGDAFSLDYTRGEFPVVDSIPLRLDMDIAALAAKGLAPKDEYNISLIVELDYSTPSIQTTRVAVQSNAVFPGVQAPSFSITDIAILQAELINTRFRVGIKIDNPNSFPIELSSFTYRLYGNGRFWADGSERNILRVNSKSSLSGNIFLLMNFIDMDRNLLDQIIRLDDVNYRFEGEAIVGTGVEYLPRFSDRFSLSGYSRVLSR